MFSLFAEIARDLVSERTKEGLKRAKAEGLSKFELAAGDGRTRGRGPKSGRVFQFSHQYAI